ncbi:MAG: RecX family transcriptional regulator [Candidatus Dojkabacteria bacterium]|jgi:regulatory protein|nr:RecX family transcriptional regulator [Candidatus Dojkabacteria bacterium]
MRVSKIEYQKRDPNRVNLYIDEEFFCGISLDTLASENLYEGLESTQEVLDRIVQRDLRSRFLTRVTEYLSHSPKTEFQVYRYLKNLKFKKKNVWFKEEIYLDWDNLFDEIVDKLKEYKYIDDESFARSFVSSRLRNKPRGKSVLISELISKGVSKDTAQMVCDEDIPDELEVLRNTFEKKYRGKEFDINDSKMVGFLQRKGFNWDLIQQFSQNDT